MGLLAHAQQDSTEKLKHDRVYMFLLKDESCVFGELANANNRGLTVNISVNSSHPQPEQRFIAKNDLLQMGQTRDLYYSARSSWSDVQNLKLYARESLVVQLKNRKLLKGKLGTVTPDSLAIEQPFATKTIHKSDIESVVAIRLVPETANFDFLLEEAAWVTIFTGEFYQRMFGLEGHVPVRLYDSRLPDDDSTGISKCFPALRTATLTPPQNSKAK